LLFLQKTELRHRERVRMGGGEESFSSASAGFDEQTTQVGKPTVKQPKEGLQGLVDKLIYYMGAPKKELDAPWIRYLCALNGVLSWIQFNGEARDRYLFKTKSGETKVASYSVMNMKYTGIFKFTLFTHIASGAIAQLGSSLAIALEEKKPELSRKIARVAAMAETYFHAPSAFILTPFVYGDKGITPMLYALVSFLLLLSGRSALYEADSEDAGKGKPRTELRRMCTTISVFLYVRLYAVMRGAGGMLHKQKYTVSVITAGAAMMPVGWQRWAFPAYFWVLMMYNGKTARETVNLVHEFGVDGAGARQMHLA